MRWPLYWSDTILHLHTMFLLYSGVKRLYIMSGVFLKDIGLWCWPDLVSQYGSIMKVYPVRLQCKLLILTCILCISAFMALTSAWPTSESTASRVSLASWIFLSHNWIWRLGIGVTQQLFNLQKTVLYYSSTMNIMYIPEIKGKLMFYNSLLPGWVELKFAVSGFCWLQHSAISLILKSGLVMYKATCRLIHMDFHTQPARLGTMP